MENILSIFIDESGDFGAYDHRSPYYIFTMVFHEQSNSEVKNIEFFEKSLSEIGFRNHVVHAGPLIRREGQYANLTKKERISIFMRSFNFMRRACIKYQSIYTEKKHIDSTIKLSAAIENKLERFLTSNMSYFNSFDKLIIYYDNGQIELGRIFVKVFDSLFCNMEYRLASPVNYRLLQVADIICTLELIALKASNKAMSNSETSFFGMPRDFRKDFLKPLRKKGFSNK